MTSPGTPTGDTPDAAQQATATFGNRSPQPGDTIRAKWTIDGAKTLSEAATMLERFATELRALDQQGWSLNGPVQDDYGFLVDPAGNTGADESDEFYDEFGDVDVDTDGELGVDPAHN